MQMKKKSRRRAFCAMLVFLCLLLSGCSTQKNNDGNALTIYCFEAGKADAFALYTKNSCVLIDTGLDGFGGDVLDYLSEQGIEKVDYMIISHFDRDHVGGAAKILKNIDVGQVYTTYYSKSSDNVDDFTSEVKDDNIKCDIVSKELSLQIDGINYTLYPPEYTSYDEKESNNSSLCVMAEYKGFKMFFAGDAENERISELLDYEDIKCDVLKVPYHGHYQDLLGDLIEKCSPAFAVITSSDDIKEDDETKDLLKDNDIDYYLTRKGAITITTDGTDTTFRQE
jgi:competence protein ComEC